LSLFLASQPPSVPFNGDSELVALAKGGDEGAFSKLYAIHVQRLFTMLLRLTADRDLADELTQDVFVRAWRSLDSYRGDSGLDTWLRAIGVRVLLNHRRENARQYARLVSVETLPDDPPARDATPGLRIDLDSAIASLPAGARTMLVLHDVEGYQYEEIAEMLGKNIGTVKSQVHRARQLMMEVLGE
jgi:RNA polymerase sigma-70 factor (ECF subfamily)